MLLFYFRAEMKFEVVFVFLVSCPVAELCLNSMSAEAQIVDWNEVGFEELSLFPISCF